MKKSGSYLSSCSPPTKRMRPSCTRVSVCPNRSNDQIGCIELSDVDLFGFALFHAARAFLACSSLTSPLRASVLATLNSQNAFLVRLGIRGSHLRHPGIAIAHTFWGNLH